ncbi:hypothetical protein TMatcc_005843 [Talaromyces marneffei ATCC 18224]
MSTTTRDCRVRSRGRYYQTLTRPPGTLHTTHHYTIAPSPLCCHCHLPLSLSDPCPITVHLSLRLSLLLNYFLTPDPLHLLHHTTYSLAHNLLHPAHPLIDVDIAILHLDTTTIKQKNPQLPLLHCAQLIPTPIVDYKARDAAFPLLFAVLEAILSLEHSTAQIQTNHQPPDRIGITAESNLVFHYRRVPVNGGGWKKYLVASGLHIGRTDDVRSATGSWHSNLNFLILTNKLKSHSKRHPLCSSLDLGYSATLAFLIERRTASYKA